MNRFSSRRREAAEEIEAHIAERVDELVESGLQRADATRQARREFGNQALFTEMSREVWGAVWLDRMGRDLRYALRLLCRNPGFTAVAVLSLALGIGANTVLLTLLESALWMPIPVEHPEQLKLLSWQGGEPLPPELTIWSEGVTAWGDDRPLPDGRIRHTALTWPMYEALKRGGGIFDNLFGYRELGRITAVVDGSAEPLDCFLVSGDFYRGMRVKPVIGRAIGRADDGSGPEGGVAVISAAYWSRRFGRDPSAIGKTITLNQVPVTIIGVNPASFTGIEPGANPEIWAPLHLVRQISPQMGALFDAKTSFWLSVMGRMKPGVSDARAQSALNVILQRQAEAAFPGTTAAWRPQFQIESGTRGMDHLANRYGKPLLILLCLAGLILLIACANVANLLLVKCAARRREFSLRLALGAGRWRIVRQLLTEGLLLTTLAGVVGTVFGYGVRNAIPALLAGAWRPSPFEAAFDRTVLFLSVGLTFLTGILFSIAPAWQVWRADVNGALKDGSRGAANPSKLRAGRLLVVIQVALSLSLLVGAGLFTQTLTVLKATPVGFHAEHVLLFAIDPPISRYPRNRRADFFAQLQVRTGAIPGVKSATFSSQPLLSPGLWRARVTPTGQATAAGPASMAIDIPVGSEFFETMSVPILYGRGVDDRDGPLSARAAVVNQEFGRRFFQEDNPVGRTFTINGGSGAYQIVGVCADGRYDFLRDPVKPTLFRQFAQGPRPGGVTFEVKATGDQAGIVGQIRKIVGSLDSGLAIADVRTQTEQIEATLSQERLLAALASTFGLLAMILACMGIYGVTAYAVARRTNEIGVRVALGAEPGRVAWTVLRETLLLSAAGVAIGIPAVVSMSRFTRSLLYGLRPNDPFTIAAAVLALSAAGLLAGYFPARRASRADPAIALRHE